MITDPKRVRLNDKGHPKECNVFSYYKVFAPGKAKEVEQWCKNALKGCTECKKEMAEILIEYLKPIREKRKRLKDNFGKEVLQPWSKCFEKAHAVAEETMAEVKDILHIFRAEKIIK